MGNGQSTPAATTTVKHNVRDWPEVDLRDEVSYAGARIQACEKQAKGCRRDGHPKLAEIVLGNAVHWRNLREECKAELARRVAI